MKVKRLFNPTAIVSSIVATIAVGLLFYYAGDRVPFLRNAQKGVDGGRA